MFSMLNSLIVATQSRRQHGQGMVEYGLILALVSVAALAVLGPIGDQIKVALNLVLVALGGTAVA